MYKFDNIVKELRCSRKLTQKDLANIIGVSQQTISMWESRKAYPDAQSVIAICNFFNVSADYLLGIEVANRRHYIRKNKTDVEFSCPRFNTSELQQVRSILDFLREQKKK